MEPHHVNGSIRRVLESMAGGPGRDAAIEIKPLHGGLEATAVALVTARYRDHGGRSQTTRFVVKQLTGRPVREALIYERLVSAHAAHMSPRLLAVDRPSPDLTLLYLERIRRVSAWAWRDLATGRKLLAQLAEFHHKAAEAPESVRDWDYEAEHRDLAVETRDALDRCRQDADLSMLARALPATDRIVRARDKLRSQLRSERYFQARPIHGDVHPGNAVVRRHQRADQPVLLDWARARIGSPLEDVGSWLQSLSFWEPEVRRRHDALLRSYLTAYGMDDRLLPHIRAAYWLAGASNALSGALLHHLQTAGDTTQSLKQRSLSFDAAQAWLRVIRRADAYWS
ncbi:phosphotransferase [Inquilinus limosus]|uniref:phosphotransferase n=1 Tax=Inquilinus limosus TaxID=171674 RepID=UPI003F5CE18D